MTRSLIDMLKCPFCGGKYECASPEAGNPEVMYGILRCHCGKFPVLHGIPILKRGVIGIAGQRADELIRLLESGRHREALLYMLIPPAPEDSSLAPAWVQALPSVRGIGRLKRWMHERGMAKWRAEAADLLTVSANKTSFRDALDLHYRRSRVNASSAYDYFVFRYGQPRHLVALSLASLIVEPGKPVLELGCGFGQVAYHLLERAKGQPVIGIDQYFFDLYVAKTRIAPRAHFICAQADVSLPFRKDFFSTVFCSDAFQFFDNKITTVEEMKRVTGDDGLLIFSTIWNGNIENHRAPHALPPEGYRSLLCEMPHCLVSDDAILTRYLQGKGPPLTESDSLELLGGKQRLSLVASHRREVFREYGEFADWPHTAGTLALNPLYVEERQNGTNLVNLRRSFPSAWYQKDNNRCTEYLPETVTVTEELLRDVAARKRTPDMERLIEKCVLLGMPSRYLIYLSVLFTDMYDWVMDMCDWV